MGTKQITSDMLRRIVNDLAEQGCKVKETRKGYFIGFPNGETTVYHHTPSDVRAQKNNRARVRRAGLHWPLDPKPE